MRIWHLNLPTLLCAGQAVLYGMEILGKNFTCKSVCMYFALNSWYVRTFSHTHIQPHHDTILVIAAHYFVLFYWHSRHRLPGTVELNASVVAMSTLNAFSVYMCTSFLHHSLAACLYGEYK